MRRDASPDAAPETPTPAGPPPGASPPPSPTGRLVGLDLARGLAILGMYTAHIGPDPSTGGAIGWAMEAARGRSAALFAVLAGFSLVILTGRPRPKTGRPGRQAVGRVLIRSVFLIALGYALAAYTDDVLVILSFYGVLFLLALPLHRLRAVTLATLAAALALVMPQVLYLLREAAAGGGWPDTVAAHDPLARLTASGGVVELLITGAYPVPTWLPFVVAGMAVAKLDLRRPRTVGRVGLAGVALAVIGYGGSWLALHFVPGALEGVREASTTGAAAPAWWSGAVGSNPEPGIPAWLLVASPHSQTTLSIVGNTGVALAVLAGCLLGTSWWAGRWALLRWITTPVSAVGSIALTAYVGHIVAIEALDTRDLPDSAALPALLWYVAATLLFATLWTRFFRRGPLEYVMYVLALPARRIP
ncbi:heparan-alpha-glucosaminide N-acetyltransferase domain-containing protein [Streptomyces sp. NPDC015131]|uniref:heparan-alpha-glucosaminide N-acetyltransferase domain-containing protein n=1 Tax=Streptomyces sp. NPDC015131 TaxID=3364941 RepID=UPI0037009977